LAERLSLTSLEKEEDPYILTKEEEDLAIHYATVSLKSNMSWKLKGMAYTDEQILKKISEIDWESKIDRAQILNHANYNKNYDIWQQERRDKERQEELRKQQELKDLWTANRVYGLMRWTSENVYHKQLVFNDNNRKLISALCFLVSSDIRYETELGYSFKKGLLIRGVSGLGKTFCVKCIEKNEIKPIKVVSMIEISNELKQEGEYQINQGKNKMIYLDDVGTEEATINHYGTKINWFKDFIETVYLRGVERGFGGLIISTNNSFAEIESKYGFRVRSRCKDMFNILDIQGEDMRG